MLKHKIPPFFLIFVAGLCVGVLLANVVTLIRVANVAAIKTVNVSVYWDLNCTEPVTLIDWGILEPNESKTFLVYVQSASNVPLNVSIYTENWSPENASTYVNLSANPNDFNLQPNQIAQIALTLNVASNITGIDTFGFDIVFNGSENE